MKNRPSMKPVPHLAMQTDERVVLDETDALLLRRISETNSLTEAAKLLGISYRNAWGRIRKIESMYGEKILATKTGGEEGGSSRLTPQGAALFREFRSMRKYLFNVLDERESAGNVRYKLSARNIMKARVVRIQKGDITSLVRMTSTGPLKLTSIISNDAVDDLALREGDEVVAVIKSTDVMVAKPSPSPRTRKSRIRRS